MMTTIQGRIVECLPITSGVSRQTGNIWKSQQYLIAVDDDQDNIICVQVFGEEKILSYDLKKGKRIAMIIDIECKDWNGKWVVDKINWNEHEEGEVLFTFNDNTDLWSELKVDGTSIGEVISHSIIAEINI